MDRYAVIGHPVEHSLSPRIQGLFAEQTGQAMTYGRLDPGPQGLADAVQRFFAEGGRGLNVTVPFKGAAAALCRRLSARAASAGVVNTLAPHGDGLFGDNTDGIGLVRDLTINQGIELAGARLLLLGAGGAARGVLAPLLEQAPAEVLIANRTPARAEALAADFAAHGPVRGCGFALPPAARGFDVVINASAASLGGEVPPIEPDALAAGGVAYDMMYGDAARAFLDWARARGAVRAFDGLGMLVEQAAESFALWRAVRPETAPVIAALRRA